MLFHFASCVVRQEKTQPGTFLSSPFPIVAVHMWRPVVDIGILLQTFSNSAFEIRCLTSSGPHRFIKASICFPRAEITDTNNHAQLSCVFWRNKTRFVIFVGKILYRLSDLSSLYFLCLKYMWDYNWTNSIDFP